MKTYLFVDAENHFRRATAVAEQIIGSPKAARAMSELKRVVRGFPEHIHNDKWFWWNPEIQLFWDCQLLSRGGLLAGSGVDVVRAIYACSCTGDNDKAHDMRVQLRNYGFEPIVVCEPKNLRERREYEREQYGLIEKPKGCDIAIATRMVADAAANLYQCCFLFTSDADFLPAIKAVRQMGKIVWVFGFRSALQARSPYLYVPDRFEDLYLHLKLVWANKHDAIRKALKSLEESEPTA